MKCLSACQHCRGVLCTNCDQTHQNIDENEYEEHEQIDYDTMTSDCDIYYIDEEIIDSINDISEDPGQVTMVVKTMINAMDKCLLVTILYDSLLN